MIRELFFSIAEPTGRFRLAETVFDSVSYTDVVLNNLTDDYLKAEKINLSLIERVEQGARYRPYHYNKAYSANTEICVTHPLTGERRIVPNLDLEKVLRDISRQVVEKIYPIQSEFVLGEQIYWINRKVIPTEKPFRTVAEFLQTYATVDDHIGDYRFYTINDLTAEKVMRAGFMEPQWSKAFAVENLIDYLRNNADMVAGKRVLDVGCGSGLGAIAAMRAGAESACACDIDALAVAVAAHNADLNDVVISTSARNYLGCDPAEIDFDVILIADLDAPTVQMTQQIQDWIKRLRSAGKTVVYLTTA